MPHESRFRVACGKIWLGFPSEEFFCCGLGSSSLRVNTHMFVTLWHPYPGLRSPTLALGGPKVGPFFL